MIGGHVVEGDVTKPEDVDEVFKGQNIDGVVVCVGGKTKKNGPSMCTDGTRCVIEACKKYGVSRIAVVTSNGCGDSEKDAPFFFKLLMKSMMKKIFADKNNQEKLFLEPTGVGHELDYVIVRPGGMNLDKPSGVVNADGKAGDITRADVADFLLKAVSEVDFPYIKKAVCLSSNKGTGFSKDRTVAAQGVRDE
mmetsp:Transcript_23883/g.31093  ORF Transcript_23883/g.31093 Transcript_23883/m.31093 type:complete len:193 (+) Transcript_23883:273-851(+)